MQEKAHEYKALCIRPTDELTYKREKDHRRLQRLKERNRYSLNNQAGSRAEALAASQPTSWQPYSTLWPAIRLVSRSRPAHSMWRAAVVLYAHDVVRRRLPLNVVVLAHHVHFAQVQKESTRRTQDLWFSRGTDHHRRAVLPSTRHTRPLAAACFPRLLSRSGTIISARGTTQVKCCRPSPQPASRWSPPSPLPLPPRPSWYLRIRCCAPQ